MPERKTVGQLMEEMRLKAGAQNYHGHEYMDLERFAEDTRHMIIFDVLTHDSPVGWKGERTRLFLTEAGYQKSLENQEKGHIKILQDSYGTYQLKGESYEARLCLANGACFRGTPDKDAFPFIMLIRESTLTGQSGGEYLQAEKHYILL